MNQKNTKLSKMSGLAKFTVNFYWPIRVTLKRRVFSSEDIFLYPKNTILI